MLWQSPCDVEGKVELDEFQNVYVYDNHTVQKFDKSGANHFTFSNLRRGDIASVDVSNPLRILVHYSDNNEVVFLDNTLSEQNQSVNFNDLEVYDVSLVCSSFQNHLWLYRIAAQKLVRLNKNGEVMNESANIGLWLSEDGQNFTHLKESGNYLYLMTEDGLILVFDQYGAFIRKVRIPFSTHYHFYNDKILYLSDKNEVKVFDVRLMAEDVLVELGGEEQMNFDQIDFNLGHISLLSKGQVSLYSISQGPK